MNEITKMAVAAVVASVVWVFFLMAIIYSATIGTETSLIWVIKFTALLASTASVIVWWMRYLRAYVDNAIERRVSEMSSPESTPAE